MNIYLTSPAGVGAVIFLGAFGWLVSNLSQRSRSEVRDVRLSMGAIALGFAMMIASVLAFEIIGAE
jgi:hypothetical protein